MAFINDVLNVIKTIPQWDDISAETIRWSDYVLRKNDQRCFEINSEIARTINRREDMEALLVGAHYPEGTPNCSNYYVLAREKKSGEVVLVDGWVNALVEGMREPFIGGRPEAEKFMRSFPSIRWDMNWNLGNMVVSSYNANVPSDLKEREEFRKKWGEFGKGLNFDVPQQGEVKGTSPVTQSVPFGEPLTLNTMNEYAMRFGLNLNHIVQNTAKGRE